MPKRILTVSYIFQREVKQPFVRMQGRWLAEAGFQPGDKIDVEVDYGRLIVTKVNSDGSQMEAPRAPSVFGFMHGLLERDPQDGDGEV